MTIRYGNAKLHQIYVSDEEAETLHDSQKDLGCYYGPCRTRRIDFVCGGAGCGLCAIVDDSKRRVEMLRRLQNPEIA